MQELKPCPFCGGEGDWYEVKPGYGYVSCDTCDATIGCFDALPKQDAIEAWNTRAERTCRVVRSESIGKMWAYFHEFSCDCGQRNLFTSEKKPPRYCPNCGAKVVE